MPRINLRKGAEKKRRGGEVRKREGSWRNERKRGEKGMEREKYFVITILIPKNSKSLSGHIGPQGFLACQSTLEQWSPLIIEIVRFVGRLLFEPLEGGRGIPVTRFRTFFGTMIISVLFFFSFPSCSFFFLLFLSPKVFIQNSFSKG